MAERRIFKRKTCGPLINGGAKRMTELDRAQVAAQAGGDAGRLAFFGLLADTPLLVLLEREAEGGVLEPRIFDLDEGQVVLAFDAEERLAGMGQGPLPYAQLPGRVLARLLVEEGLGLGLNLGSGSASEMLLPLTAMRWLTEMLDEQSQVQLAALGPLAPPEDGFVVAVERILAGAPDSWGGLAQELQLYRRQDAGLLLISGAAAEAETALATAVSEALRFADLGGLVVDIAFADAAKLPDGGVRLLWPKAAPAPEPTAAPNAPGMEPNKPPILR